MSQFSARSHLLLRVPLGIKDLNVDMKSIISIVFLGAFFAPTFSQSTISSCGGVIDTSGSTISYKLNELISKNERCIWTVRVPNAVTYTLNVNLVGTRNKRTVTGTCISINGTRNTEVNQYGILDSTETRELRTPCEVLVIALYSGEETSDGKGFSMRITAKTGLSRLSSDSRQLIVNQEEGVTQHPPADQTKYSDNEISTFIFIPPKKVYNPTKTNLITLINTEIECNCKDYLLVYKFRAEENPEMSWEGNQTKDVDKICRDTSHKIWASDDVIMVIFRSDDSITRAGLKIRRSFEPAHNSVRFTGNIFSIQSKTDISEPRIYLRQVQIAENRIFLNNGSSSIERYFESWREMTDTFSFQLFNVTDSHNPISIESGVILDLGPTIPPHLRNQSESVLQAIKSNETVVNKRELRVREKLTLHPCTKLEATWLVEMAEVENVFEVNLKVSATFQGSKRMEANHIPYYFKGLSFTTKYDNFTAVTKTAAILRASYITTNRVNVTIEHLPDCRRQLIKMKGFFTAITPITNVSNLTPELQKFPIPSQQVFANNGITQQEKNYEALRDVTETGQFQFSKELNQLSSVDFQKDLQIDEVPSIPFLTNAWTKIKSKEMPMDKTIPDEPFKFIARDIKSFQVQEKIVIPPCTEYEVGSFVKIAKNVEVDYKMELRVTGQLGSDSIDVEEIRENLKGLKFLRKENNFTGVFETTAKLKLVYGVSSGIDAVETSIPSCRSRFIKYAGNIINLERMPNLSNSTGSFHFVEIVPKEIFTNNGTVQQEDYYEAAKVITETAKFEFDSKMKVITSIKFEEDAKDELEKSIPFFPAVATQLSGSLAPSKSTWNQTVVFGVKNKKEFKVHKRLVVAPCTKYEVDSSIKIAENVETRYKVLLEVTGRLGDDAVRAEEIRSNLNHLTFLRNEDDFTVITETIMKLKVTHGASSGVNAEGKQLLDCLAIQAELVANCKFVCSG